MRKLPQSENLTSRKEYVSPEMSDFPFPHDDFPVLCSVMTSLFMHLDLQSRSLLLLHLTEK